MSLQLVLDVLLGITPVPGLSAAFNLLKIIVSSIQQARESKRQLEALAYAVAQLLDTLNAEFRATRLVLAASARPLQDLYSLLEDIRCFIRDEHERPFLKALFTQDSRISEIEGFYRQIGTVASAFQISALLNIQRMLSHDERARGQDSGSVNSRLRMLELNQMHLLHTVGLNPAVAASNPQLASVAQTYEAWVQYGYPPEWGQTFADAVAMPPPIARPPPRPRILVQPRKTDPYYGFTNSSAHPVKYNGKLYPTSEHLFQAFKYMDLRPDIAEQIRACKSPSKAFKHSMAHLAHQHPDWDRMNISKMEITLYHKFAQNEELRQQLLGTGDAELVHYTQNEFWGVGKDQRGRNELGKVLERVRSSLREARVK